DWFGIPQQAFYDLTTTKCREFNELVTDVPSVRYFSVAGRHEGDWWSPEWQLPHQIVLQTEGPNDGVVSVTSASYGETIDVWNGDHLSLVNWPGLTALARGRVFDRTPDYTALVRRLADAGLDLEVYERTLASLAPLLKRTHSPRVISDPPTDQRGKKGGFFASLFSLDYNSRLFAKNYRRPVLVTCTDGVGSKLKIAGLMNKHDTVGIDLVAMSVNDCLCTGGEPLVFLDYLAMPKDDPALTKALVQGISDGCLQADCSLTGGETAILPDFYAPGAYDMAGFCVGVVERAHIINGKAIQLGDVVLG